MRTRRNIQNQIVISLQFKEFRELEIIVHRLNSWIYFNVGRYHNYPKVKRVAFDFFIELRGRIYGFSWEKAVEVVEVRK